jgi:hypothetical protein
VPGLADLRAAAGSPGPPGPYRSGRTLGRGRHRYVAGPARRDPCGGTGTTRISHGSGGAVSITVKQACAAADAVRPALGTSRMARPANDPYGQPIDPGAFSMAQNDAPMVVKPFFSREFGRCGVCWETDKTGKGRSWWRAGSYQVTRFSRVRNLGPGRPADRSKASTGCGSRFAGQAAPGTAGVSRRRAGGGRPGGRRTASGSG